MQGNYMDRLRELVLFGLEKAPGRPYCGFAVHKYKKKVYKKA